jgi:hypothetical protein
MKAIQDVKHYLPKLLRILKVASLTLVAASTSLIASRVKLPGALQVTAVVIAVAGAMVTAICRALAGPTGRKDKGDGGSS